MVLQVRNNPESVKKGDIVVFLTGKKSVNTHPQFMRVGEVVQGYNDGETYTNGKGYTVRELSTGKLWYPYTQDTILVNDGIGVKGVKAVIQLTERP